MGSLSLPGLVQETVLLGLGLGMALVLARWVDYRPAASLGYPLSDRWRRELLLGLGAGIALPLLVLIAQVAAGAVDVRWAGPDRQITIGWLALVLIVLAVAGTAEEVAFRGYLLQTLVQGIGTWAAVLLPALFFGAAHLVNKNATLIGAANIFVLGALMGCLCVKSRALRVTSGFHLTANLGDMVIREDVINGKSPYRIFPSKNNTRRKPFDIFAGRLVGMFLGGDRGDEDFDGKELSHPPISSSPDILSLTLFLSVAVPTGRQAAAPP